VASSQATGERLDPIVVLPDGALAAWLAMDVLGISWDAVTQAVTITLVALVGGLAGGVGAPQRCSR
jgi:hypothetical protein